MNEETYADLSPDALSGDDPNYPPYQYKGKVLTARYVHETFGDDGEREATSAVFEIVKERDGTIRTEKASVSSGDIKQGKVLQWKPSEDGRKLVFVGEPSDRKPTVSGNSKFGRLIRQSCLSPEQDGILHLANNKRYKGCGLPKTIFNDLAQLEGAEVTVRTFYDAFTPKGSTKPKAYKSLTGSMETNKFSFPIFIACELPGAAQADAKGAFLAALESVVVDSISLGQLPGKMFAAVEGDNEVKKAAMALARDVEYLATLDGYTLDGQTLRKS